MVMISWSSPRGSWMVKWSLTAADRRSSRAEKVCLSAPSLVAFRYASRVRRQILPSLSFKSPSNFTSLILFRAATMPRNGWTP